MQGPMVGAVTPESAKIWVRANEPWDVEILYDTTCPFQSERRTGAIRSSKEDHYIVVFDLSGVFLVSGNTHVGELNCIPWSERGGCDLHEVVTSPLAAPTYLRYALDVPEIRIRPSSSPWTAAGRFSRRCRCNHLGEGADKTFSGEIFIPSLQDH